MKKLIVPIVIAIAASLCGCNTTKQTNVASADRHEISWIAFCQARGYDINDNTGLAINEYLDAWCGSAEEEIALINAGIEPY